jgi:flagellin-like protein
VRILLTKKTLKSKKAISPILATLLLIVIAVAAIVVTYAWIMTYMHSTSQQAGVLLYEENARFTNTTQAVFTIGNQGTADTQIARVYLGNSSGNMQDITVNCTILTGPKAGSTCTVTITLPQAGISTWASGTTYYFKIAPNPGQNLEFTERAP